MPVPPIRRSLWPEIKAFLDKGGHKRFGDSVKIKFQWNTLPLLKLKHEGGLDTVKVDRWTTAQLDQFLSERVKA